VNGKTVDWETYPLFESPYINSEWESGYIVISKDGRKCTLDFRNFNNPVKTCEILKDLTPPVADSGPDQNVVEDTLVTFDGSGSSDNIGITSYTWSFMDVTPQTLTGVNPTYTFSTPGTYIINLKVTDAAGNYATDTVTITVLDVTKPVANVDYTMKIGTTVVFNAGGSSDNVAIVSYEWDFRDETTGTGMTTTHTYKEPGTYTVTLTVRDAAGNSDMDTVVVTIFPAPFSWWIIGVIAATVITLGALVLWRRKRALRFTI